MLQSNKNVSFYGCWQGSDQQILESLFSMANGHGLPQGEINLLHQVRQTSPFLSSHEDHREWHHSLPDAHSWGRQSSLCPDTSRALRRVHTAARPPPCLHIPAPGSAALRAAGAVGSAQRGGSSGAALLWAAEPAALAVLRVCCASSVPSRVRQRQRRGRGALSPPRSARRRGRPSWRKRLAFRFPSAREEAGAAAAMQVSSLNEVKIYSLSAGRSLPEVRAARGGCARPGPGPAARAGPARCRRGDRAPARPGLAELPRSMCACVGLVTEKQLWVFLKLEMQFECMNLWV